MQSGIFNIDIYHSVQTYRAVVIAVLLGLNQRYKNINIGTHCRSGLKFKTGSISGRFNTADIPESRPVFQTDNGHTSLRRRNSQLYFFTCFIILFVSSNIECCCSFIIGIFCPGTEISDDSAGMS